MSDTFFEFDTRLKRIDRTRARMANGYSSHVGKDGLIVFRPKSSERRLPLNGLSMIALAFFGLKGLIMAHLGSADYMARVQSLKDGSALEGLGAWAMQPEVVSTTMARMMALFIG